MEFLKCFIPSGILRPGLSSDPTDTSCFAAGGGSATDPGGCDAPVDVNADGTGTDQTFKNFVSAIATHVGTQIAYWEIWNEPTSPGQWRGTTAQLIRMAQDASHIIKAANLNALILSPCPVGPNAAATWMDGFLSGGGGQYVDIISFHSYVNNDVAEQVITGGTTMHAVMAKYGQQNKPLWSSEAGWGADSSASTDILQTAFLARYSILHWSSGIQRLYWYAWDNPTFGTLWDSTNGIHPAGNTYQVMENWLVGATMPQSCAVNNSTYTCPLTRSGAYQAQIVFNPNSTLSYSAPSQYIQYRDVFGNMYPVPNALTIGPAPIMLETNTPATSTAPPLGSPTFFVTAPQSMMTSGGTASAQLNVTPENGFVSPVTFACAGLPAGASCSFSPATAIPSAGSVNVTFTVALNASTAKARRLKPFLALMPALFGIALGSVQVRKQARSQNVFWLVPLVLAIATINGCGGGSKSSAVMSGQTYAITVTASSGAIQHSSPVQLTVGN